ncbi:MAG: chloride channel protein [Oscillospiraceae bacterium]|nr:chloride channel protein [Oscillospiraceae bacterium]
MRGAMHTLLHLRLLIRWMLFSLLIGVLLGFIGAAFVWCIGWATGFRAEHKWCYLLLPAGGLLIVWLYRVTHDKHDRGTNMVLASLRSEAQLPMQMAPLIFVSTVITHFCGGSAGREGAALQLGGSLAGIIGKLFRVREKDQRTLILTGMSAAFSAIFRTPAAACVFAMEVGCVGTMQYAALVPCTIASLTASFVAERLGFPLAHYEILEIPELGPVTAAKTLLLGLCCAALSILFCVLLHRTEHLFKKLFKSRYLRIVSAAVLLLVMGLLVRSEDYFGIGGSIIHRAVAGEAVWYAFLLKMLFTAVTLGGGFKGGEIVPSFFVGATFGCMFGHIAGISPSLCAAIGMVALFCGVTNCPLAALFISAELFGMESVPYCLLVIAVSYLLSGYYGLYKEQRFFISKFADEHVHHKTRK